MSLSRRHFLGLAGGVGLAATLPGCALTREQQTGEQLRSAAVLPERFTVPLPVPPIARPIRTSAGVDYYEIVQRAADIEILPGLRTPILGYDGIYPGPTVVSRSGRPTVVRHVNRLTVPTVVHLHGGHTPPDSDGFPIDLLLPEGSAPAGSGHEHAGRVMSGSREHEYPMSQRAATLWYHDHRMDFTGPAVYRGLAGFHLVHDDEDDALPLPRGDRDIPLMIADRAFEQDGSFRYPALDPGMLEQPGVEDDYMEGVLGDVILVNGAPWPLLEVANVRYRLRLLNASNARRYDLGLSPAGTFTQIGSDGGLLAAPVEHGGIRIAAGERFDVLVDFSSYPLDTDVTLVNRLGSGSTASVMQFRVTRREVDDSAVPTRLSDIEPLVAAAPVRAREFRATRGAVGDRQGWTVNGLVYDPERVDGRLALGEVERWRFISDVHHPLHVHLDPFQVLRRGSGTGSAYDVGWKDTMDIRAGETVEVAIRFQDYRGIYVMHCHNLEHEDMAMMTNVETL